MGLIDEILSEQNLNEAIKVVKRNKGAAGIDKITVNELDEYFSKNGSRIKASIKAKEYKPAPVRRVYIPKPNGSQRPLGIPTVGDRAIQQAAAQKLVGIYEPHFSEFSYADDCSIFVKSEKAADRVMKSVTSWLERKLFLKVSATKTKVTKPTNSSFLGFGFWKSTKGWKCKPLNDRKERLYEKCKPVLLRKRAAAIPLAVTFTKLNQIIRGWINYYRIGSMKGFLEQFGQWLRHKIRVVIVKQWKKPVAIYRNLMKLNKMFGCNMTDEDIYKVANSRLGLYRQCGMNVVNYLLSPKVLAKENKSRPGLVDPLSYYLSSLQ